MYKLIVIHEADLELQDAIVWYEERGAGLGVSLLRIVKERLEIIQKYPERYPKRKKNFRESVLQEYPYSIVYSFYKSEGIILVSSIFHNSRNPRKKYRKQRK